MGSSRPYDGPGLKAHPDIFGHKPVWWFNYVNWKGEKHSYQLIVEGIELTALGSQTDGVPLPEPKWQVHGECVERSGQHRLDRPRRSFILDQIQDLRTEYR